MTNDEIDKLEAGPEINALVAEAMGKLRHKGSWYEVESPRSEWISGFHGKKDAMEWLGRQYLFSENISAVWEVVEKLRGSYLVVIRQCAQSYWCDLEINEAEEWQVEAPTAPLAICRAVLKAKLVDKQPLTK